MFHFPPLLRAIMSSGRQGLTECLPGPGKRQREQVEIGWIIEQSEHLLGSDVFGGDFLKGVVEHRYSSRLFPGSPSASSGGADADEPVPLNCTGERCRTDFNRATGLPSARKR